MSQDAAQTSAAGSDDVNDPIESTAVSSECSSSRIFAYVRSSSLISTRSGRSTPTSPGTAETGPAISVSTDATRTRPSLVSEYRPIAMRCERSVG
jgi:hypothetical protein